MSATSINAIEIKGLSKKYGSFKALDDLTIDIPQGKVFGFLGPNGAGKTTTTRILAGLIHPTTGTITILGHDLVEDASQIKHIIGYLPDVPAFYEWMRADEYLTFTGELFGLEGSKLKKRVAELLDAAGLSDVKRKVGTFSRGMKQRLGIAQAFINDPDILFMDEPTSALDPIGRKEVLDLIESLSEKKTVFFSTHILGDVERVCDSVGIIDKGRLVIQGDLEDIKNRYKRPAFVIEVDEGAHALAERLRSVPWVTKIAQDDGSLLVDVSDVRKAQLELVHIVAGFNIPLRKLELKESSLEEIFVELVEEHNEPPKAIVSG